MRRQEAFGRHETPKTRGQINAEVEMCNMDVQEMPSQDQDGLAGDVMENIGATGEEHSQETTPEQSEGMPSKETLAVQKRLKSQKRAHEREVRDLHARIGDLETRMSQPINASHDQMVNPNNMPSGNDIAGHIQQAVSYALQHRDHEERKAHEAQQKMHVQRHYQDFEKHLDSMGDVHDDFHDVVFGRDVPYTPAMRDYALTLPRSGAGSAGQVLYKLGKNPEELQRIAKLHPLDQASEMAKLSHALISGGDGRSSNARQPLGNIKSNPVTNSHVVNDKTPIGSIRDRMKSGSWK
jgi:hypothetical protein